LTGFQQPKHKTKHTCSCATFNYTSIKICLSHSKPYSTIVFSHPKHNPVWKTAN
jgi:hypothetical protein